MILCGFSSSLAPECSELLYHDIIPLFYDRDEAGLPHDWIGYVKNSIAHIAPAFTTKRMIDDYNDRYYGKLNERTINLRAENYQLAKDLAGWKKKVEREWDDIKIMEMKLPDPGKNTLKMGDKYEYFMQCV